MNDRSQSLQTVATGLVLVYAGLCLLVVSYLGLLVGLFLSVGQGADRWQWVLILALGMMVVTILMDMIGRLLCLAMPPEQSGTRVIIAASVCFTLAALALSAIDLINTFVPIVQLPPLVSQFQPLLALIGAILFVLFLRNLALFVQRPDLGNRANVVLVLGGVTGVALIVLTILTMSPRNPRPGFGRVELFGLAVFVLAVALLIQYGNLLTYLRTAIRNDNSAPSTED
jgi:hypothetical protein